MSLPGADAVNRADEYQSGGPQHARRSKRRERQFGGVRHYDRALAANAEPPLGSHLVTPRRGFAHHGIYVGRGNVVHYRSVVRHFCRGPVEEVSLASFAQERAIWIRSQSTPRFDGAEVTSRARSRLGEDRYRLLSNNCEHLVEWCLRDQHRSYQVERLLALPRRLARVCGEAMARLLPGDNCAFGRPMRVLRTLPRDHST